MSVRHHDLIIIGTGSGNAVIDDSFSDLNIALIEDRRMGGTCLNYGCIPSKMLAYTAERVDAVDTADQFDIEADLRALHWRGLRDRVFGRIDRLSAEGREEREESDNITFYDGHRNSSDPESFESPAPTSTTSCPRTASSSPQVEGR